MAATGRPGGVDDHAVGEGERGDELRGARLHVEGGGHHGPQRVAELRHAAAEHHDVGVDGQREHPDGGRDARGEPGPHVGRLGVAGLGRREQRLRGGQVGRRPGRGDGRAGRDGLEAAALPAAAQQPGGVDRQVPDLAGRAETARAGAGRRARARRPDRCRC